MHSYFKSSAFISVNTLLYTTLQCSVHYSVLSELCRILMLLSSLKVAPLLITLVTHCPASQRTGFKREQ